MYSLSVTQETHWCPQHLETTSLFSKVPSRWRRFTPRQRLSSEVLTTAALRQEIVQLNKQSTLLRNRFLELRNSSDEYAAFAALQKERDEHALRIQQLLNPARGSNEIVRLFLGYVSKHLPEQRVNDLVQLLTPILLEVDIDLVTLLIALREAAKQWRDLYKTPLMSSDISNLTSSDISNLTSPNVYIINLLSVPGRIVCLFLFSYWCSIDDRRYIP